MVDFERARAQMVESQVRVGGVTDAAILACMRAIPREEFVAAHRRNLAYIDDVQWLGDKGTGRFMIAPAALARLLRLADVAPSDTVLDLGAATGYSTAVIAGLAGSVTGLEPDAALAADGAANLRALGLDNASIIAGDVNSLGQARFDVIIVQGALDTVPEALLAALADGGRLVAVIQSGAVGLAQVFARSGGRVAARPGFNIVLPPLLVARTNEEFVF